MSRPLRIECYLIPLYRFWALTSECECAFSHRMPIRDATVRPSIGIHRAGIHSAGARSAETQGHTVQGAHRLAGISNPPRHPYGMGTTADNFTLSRLHGGVRGA